MTEEPIVYYKYFRRGKELLTANFDLATSRTDNNKVEEWQIGEKIGKNRIGIIELEE